MDLKRIEIKCYKSLIDQEIIVSDRCMAFVGLNESGKTNVLNSIRMLDWDEHPDLADKSKINNELPSTVFHFDISKNKGISDIIKLYMDNPDNIEITQTIKSHSIKISRDLIVMRELLDSGDLCNDIEFNIELELVSNKKFMIVREGTEVPDETIVQVDDEAVKIEPFLVLEKEKILETVVEYFSELTKDDVIDYIYEYFREKINDLLPSVIYWEYSKKYLIPSEISYEEFMANGRPYDVSGPLYNIFLMPDALEIDDDSDLRERISEWRTDSSKRRKDSGIINDSLNKYIKNIWKEYDQRIEVNLETDKITIHVRDPHSPDNNYYEMIQRSQGFKTFVSFLLTVAAESRLGIIENFVLVLDEPETHLHPSGTRFMKNELLKLSESGNNVFFATHSIFMIDRSNLKRHVILKKHDERSFLEKVNRNNITHESVIYEALGTSVDEFSISAHNIMFEGETDRKLFDAYLEHCIKNQDNSFSDYELLDGGGTKQINIFFRNKVIPQGTEWRIILDNDKPARILSDYLNEKYPDSTKVKINITHYSPIKDYELEDILPKAIVEKLYNDAIKGTLEEIIDELTINEEMPVSSNVKEYMSRNSIEPKIEKIVEQIFKDSLASEISKILDEVRKKSNYDDRKQLFTERLPQYAEFMEQYFLDYKNKEKAKSDH